MIAVISVNSKSFFLSVSEVIALLIDLKTSHFLQHELDLSTWCNVNINKNLHKS